MKRSLLIHSVVAFGLACGIARAQPAFEIRGNFTDPDLKAGIAGVTVSLYEFVPDATAKVVRILYASTTTGSDGGFQFHPDRANEYYLEAKKEGYMPVGQGSAADGIESRVFLRKENPSVDFAFTMTRPGEITGLLVDSLGKPVADQSVGIQSAKIAASGIRVVTASGGSAFGPSMKTGADGVFVISKLPPGQYTVRATPKIFAGVMRNFTHDDIKAVDESFESTPVPVTVFSGSTVNAGRIEVRMATYYRAHIRVRSDSCADGQRWTLISDVGFGLGGIPCAPELLVGGLSSGAHTFALWSGEANDTNSQWGLATVEVGRENIEVEMALNPCANLDGRIVAADGVTLPALNGIRLGFEQLSTTGASPPEVLPDAQGKFLLRGVRFPRHQLEVYGLQPPYYVKEIRYNGVPMASRIFTVSPGSGQQIEIVIDDKGSSIRGVVSENDRPESNSNVVLARSPLPPDAADAVRLLIRTNGDESGKFQFAGLAPGEYRAVALPQGSNKSVDSDTLLRLLSGAEKIVLDPGASQNLMLTLTRP
jgi:hypothetical protein